MLTRFYLINFVRSTHVNDIHAYLRNDYKCFSVGRAACSCIFLFGVKLI